MTVERRGLSPRPILIVDTRKHPVLVVDDEETILKVCSQILKTGNYEPDLSPSVDDALKKLRKKEYELVISDLTLPGESGFDLLKEVKKNYPGTGVIIMTGYAEIKSAVECMKNGADDYLPKPFGMKELLGTTAKFFETKRLRDEVRKLRSADELKSKFLANVTHELRSPLTAIKSAADLCGRLIGEDDNIIKKLTGIIKNNSERMLVLVNDLLDMAELERNEIILKREMTDAGLCIENAINTIRNTADTKNIIIKFGKKVPAIVFCDNARLEEIFINLLDNAVKFSSAGSVIEVALSVSESSAKIVFADEGPGISKDKRKKVFEKFYQTGTSLSHKNKGFGIGLSLVKQLTELHGGSVEILPRKKKGTRFVVKLPLAVQKKFSQRPK